MGNSSSAPKVTAQDKAILALKNQRDKLKRYRGKVQSVLDLEQEIARDALAKGDKQRALTALRQRKYQDGLLAKTDAQLETLQNLVSQIEFSLVEKDVVFGLRQGHEALAHLNREMNVESVDKLMGDTAEAIAYQKEIGEILQGRMTVEEEEHVQNELASLQREADKYLPVQLPSVPATQPEVSESPVTIEEEHEQPQERVALPA